MIYNFRLAKPLTLAVVSFFTLVFPASSHGQNCDQLEAELNQTRGEFRSSCQNTGFHNAELDCVQAATRCSSNPMAVSALGTVGAQFSESDCERLETQNASACIPTGASSPNMKTANVANAASSANAQAAAGSGTGVVKSMTAQGDQDRANAIKELNQSVLQINQNRNQASKSLRDALLEVEKGYADLREQARKAESEVERRKDEKVQRCSAYANSKWAAEEARIKSLDDQVKAATLVGRFNSGSVASSAGRKRKLTRNVKARQARHTANYFNDCNNGIVPEGKSADKNIADANRTFVLVQRRLEDMQKVLETQRSNALIALREALDAADQEERNAHQAYRDQLRAISQREAEERMRQIQQMLQAMLGKLNGGQAVAIAPANGEKNSNQATGIVANQSANSAATAGSSVGAASLASSETSPDQAPTARKACLFRVQNSTRDPSAGAVAAKLNHFKSTVQSFSKLKTTCASIQKSCQASESALKACKIILGPGSGPGKGPSLSPTSDQPKTEAFRLPLLGTGLGS